MKPGDIVYAKYENKYFPATILTITQKTTRFLWWKKTVNLALVEIRMRTKFPWQEEWESRIRVIEDPVDELRGGVI
jgi:hypothetical protein